MQKAVSDFKQSVLILAANNSAVSEDDLQK